MQSKIIIIEGNIGSGKSVFCKSYAANNSDVIVLKEWVDEKILSEYISDMKNKATNFQFQIQDETVKRIHMAIELVKEGKTVLVDRGLIGNRCFAELQYEKGFITQKDIELYRKKYSYHLFNDGENLAEIPVEIWYLVCDVKVCMSRIKNRGRSGENLYNIEYLSMLKNKHDEYLTSSMDNMIIKKIDVNKNLRVSDDGLIDNFLAEF